MFQNLQLVVATLIVAVSAGNATGGSLKGTVRDRGKNPPNNGLSGVNLKDKVGKLTLTVPIPTNADGEYVILHVPNGKYTVYVDDQRYVPDPHETNQETVTDNSVAQDVWLTEKLGTRAYYSNVAISIVGEVSLMPGELRSQGYKDQWANLRGINMPPSSKAILAHELVKQNQDVRDIVPGIADYLSVNPEEVAKLQVTFRDALTKSESVPSQDELPNPGISQKIVADVVLCQFRGRLASKERREAFVQEFLLKWDSTKASKSFIESVHDLKLDATLSPNPLNRGRNE